MASILSLNSIKGRGTDHDVNVSNQPTPDQSPMAIRKWEWEWRFIRE